MEATGGIKFSVTFSQKHQGRGPLSRTSPLDLNAAHVTRCKRKSNGYPELAATKAAGALCFERTHEKLAASPGSREPQ